MQYKWKDHDYKLDAQKVGEALNTIQEELGYIEPAVIVEAARPVDNILHTCFTWDNTVAANSYRNWEARMLMRCIMLVIDKADDQPEIQTVAFVNIQTKTQHGYMSFQTVMLDKVAQQYMMDEAQREMNRFIAKYKNLKALADIIGKMTDFLDSGQPVL